MVCNQGLPVCISQHALQVPSVCLNMAAVYRAARTDWFRLLRVSLFLPSAQCGDCEGICYASCWAEAVASSPSDTPSPGWERNKVSRGAGEMYCGFTQKRTFPDICSPRRNSFGSNLTLVVPGVFFSCSSYFCFERKILKICKFMVSPGRVLTLP